MTCGYEAIYSTHKRTTVADPQRRSLPQIGPIPDELEVLADGRCRTPYKSRKPEVWSSVPAALEAHKAKASDFDPPVPFAGHMSGAGAPAPDAPRFPLIQMILSGWPCSLQASVSRRATVKRFGLSLTEDVQSDLVQGDVRYAVSNVDYANLARRLCATLVQHAALNPRTTVQHDSTSVLGQLGAMRVPHGDDARIRILFQHVVDGSPRHAKTGWQLRHGIDSHGR